MALKENAHVAKLSRYLPFSPLHSQIYEEQANPDHVKSIATKAGKFLKDAASDPSVRLVVLTGDAGHGKTHLCRVLLEQVLGLSPKEAHSKLRQLGDGRHAIGTVAGRELYVVRDLSEIADIGEAVSILVAALETASQVLVVCANEGKLRKVVAEAGSSLALVRDTLERGRTSGRTAIHPHVTVLDLNNQSVTAGEGGGFLGELLQQWVGDGRSWRVCSDCDAAKICPIRYNRDALSDENDTERGRTRRDGLRTLLEVVEQSGSSITIRELLILMAFAITGGLDCRRVHEKWRRKRDDRSWQPPHVYSQAIFDPPLGRDDRNALSIFAMIARIDPGNQAIRVVDEVLAADPLLVDDVFVPGQLIGSSETPRTRKDAKKESELHSRLFRYLRRRDYFELRTEDETGSRVSRSERLGFKFHDEFSFLLSEAPNAERTVVRDKVLRGLEAVQDVRRSRMQSSKFAVVDPAFANVRGVASVLAAMVPSKKVTVTSVSQSWGRSGGPGASVSDAVDWVDRHVMVRFEEGDVSLPLDLLRFEFVLRSAEGLSCRDFFKADIRRIAAVLARVAKESTLGDGEIHVAFGDRVRTLSIDEGNKIVCEGETE